MNWAPEAVPQSPEEVRNAPPCPEVVEAARERGITSIVHFTRIGGLKGILASATVKARRYLSQDERLKYVAEENAPDRSRDSRWHGYVNMSVSGINVHMFKRSKRWHPDDQWVILEFAPEFLGDPGVVFSTTNNAYSEVVHRCAGLAGFEQMFAPRVPWGYYDCVHTRRHRHSHETTDPQAEVLYPVELGLEHLRRIIAGDEHTLDRVVAVRTSFSHCPYVDLTPEAFQ